MLKPMLSFLLLLSICGAASTLSCRWINHKFSQYSRNSLTLLEAMVNNSTNATNDEDGIAFPKEQYKHAAKAPVEDRISMVVQVLDEVVALFEVEHNATMWSEGTVENFLNVLIQQADGLQACIGEHKKKNKKLHMYFKRLSHHVLEQMGRSAAAWELVRKDIKIHLFFSEQLIAPLIHHN